ncbi:enoyl-CoA hydratase/isomerase family protein, partial [Streptomyces olivaceus]
MNDDVLFRTGGHAAHIALNRPGALNSLTHDMVLRIDAKLTEWEHDPAVETVVITGEGERGLCAGGDIRAIHDDARDGDGSTAAAFWR